MNFGYVTVNGVNSNTIIGSYNSQVKLLFTFSNMNDMIFKKK